MVIPAFLNNEVGILDDTLRAHARLAYRGPLTVLLVYNKGPAGPAGPRLEEAESELRATWAGREEGNVRCVSEQRAWPTSRESLQRRPPQYRSRTAAAARSADIWQLIAADLLLGPGPGGLTAIMCCGRHLLGSYHPHARVGGHAGPCFLHCCRRFQVIEKPGSRSKAENVNYALKFVTASPGAVVAIFDADHHPVRNPPAPALRPCSKHQEQSPASGSSRSSCLEAIYCLGHVCSGVAHPQHASSLPILTSTSMDAASSLQ